MNLPEVSVILAAYNASRFLPATLESILAQEDVSLEVLAVDDCSTDDTGAVIARYAAADARVIPLRTESNSGGPSAPRNVGVRAARSDWVAICDSDDLWHPRKLRIQLDCARQTGADAICTAMGDFRGEHSVGVSALAVPAKIPIVPIRYWQLLMKNRVPSSSVLCRTKTIVSAGYFDPDRNLSAVEDYDLWLRMMEPPTLAKVLRLELPLVAYRRRDDSISSGKVRLSRKVLRVLQRAARRRGWHWAFPIVAPILFTSYALQSFYLRVLRARL